MQKHIQSIVEEILSSKKDLSNTTLILPSKRAIVFVKKAFKAQISSYQFLPNIVSIEKFINRISKTQGVNNLTLLFEFYNVYLENTDKDKLENFEEFSNWASILITDFNEIDSYLIDQNNIFSYLKDISRIEAWFKKDESKNLSTKYILFFEQIETYYNAFYKHLVNKNIGYQGLQYREANNNIDMFIERVKHEKFVFIGFNTLNKSEENIIQKLLHANLASIFFDIDETYLKENLSASMFVKKYKNDWLYFKHNKFNSITNALSSKKNITTIGVPKNVSQIKYANEIIESKTALNSEQTIALVLANEALLIPTINSLPNNVAHINITMGLPLKNIQYADLFNLLFKMHQTKVKLDKNNRFYYKNVISILNHPVLNKIIPESNALINSIKKDNLIFLQKENIINLIAATDNPILIDILFSDWKKAANAIRYSLEIINELIKTTENQFEIEYLGRFKEVFLEIALLNKTYGFIDSLDGLLTIFNQVLNNETLSFKGDATKGLQIMGVLETRVLEFETLILTSVNEGFLPSGKSNNSFIPFDVKVENNLPTFKEKDAVFSYHFFRLIARAKNIYLLYNTETDDLGSGEKSRFLTQLELLKDGLPNLTLTKKIVSPKIDTTPIQLKKVEKDKSIIEKLALVNQKGFSPTALTNYIYNPIAFYKQKILGVYQQDEIEETIAANTLGNIVHKVLEDFYLPFKGKYIKIADVLEMKKRISSKVASVFNIQYKNGDISKGKNLLSFEVVKQYVLNFLNQEVQLLKQKKTLKIIALELNLHATINVEGVDFPINLNGQADRIDELDGILRIIDYKTGKTEQKHLIIKKWEDLSQNYKLSKAFQVLLYAYMYAKMKKLSFDIHKIESGIISFKNLKAGFMKVNKSTISQKNIENFEVELKQILQEIYNIEIPFIENENLPY